MNPALSFMASPVASHTCTVHRYLLVDRLTIKYRIPAEKQLPMIDSLLHFIKLLQSFNK
jgi:hypothetical protein